MLIHGMCEDCNNAINAKRIELLGEGKDLTKPAVVKEIIKEWHIMKSQQQQKQFSLVGSFKVSSWPAHRCAGSYNLHALKESFAD